VGVLVDLDSQEISFSLNGKSMGVAFTGIYREGLDIYPGITLEQFQACSVNLGQKPFLYCLNKDHILLTVLEIKHPKRLDIGLYYKLLYIQTCCFLSWNVQL
jgi:hypothetical protein